MLSMPLGPRPNGIALRGSPAEKLTATLRCCPIVGLKPSALLCARLAGRTARCLAPLPARGGGGLNSWNSELVIGDCVLLVSYGLYKQVSALVLQPDFPGWFAPLSLNPIRFVEFLSFILTLTGVWCSAGLLTNGFSFAATRNIPNALAFMSRQWLLAMPLAACQLVLVVALESGSLVGEEGFASVLPLAASGSGEPFVTAAGILGLMSVWRSYYSWGPGALYSFATMQRQDDTDKESFISTLQMVGVVAVIALVQLEVLQSLMQWRTELLE